jgi:hypothetical protein
VNPNLDFLVSLPNVVEVTIHFHTAGLTASVWMERERLRMENAGDLQSSKRLKVLRLAEVIAKYDLNKLLACRNLRMLNLVCLDSDRVRYHCSPTEPMSGFRELKNHFMVQFLQLFGGRRVDVFQFREHVDAKGNKSCTAWQ